LSDEYSTEVLEYEKFTKIVDDAKKLGAKNICLSGGEPFLHPRAIDMILYVNSMGLSCYVYTSGIVFNDKSEKISLSHDFLRPISGIVNKLIFNIEGATSETYDKIMGTTGCFNVMQDSVKAANEMSIITEAHFVPMKLNVDEIEKTITLCKNIGIAKISFLRLVPHGRALINQDKILLSEEDFLKLKGLLIDIKNKSTIDVRIGVPLSIDANCHKCEAASGKLNIKYDGYVFPCEVFKNNKVAMSLESYSPENVHDKSLLQIYKNSAYLEYVREFSEQFQCSGNCETCVGQYLIEVADKEKKEDGK
jgi:radical SAM protein with 4Fe4S-binding SPASM domain